jgi:subtilase-type serine protease
MSNDLFVGGAFGYARTSTASFDTKGTTDTYAGALYTTWTPGRFVFDGRIAAGPTTTGTARTIAFPGESTMAAASFNGWGGLIAGEAGYRFDVAGAIVKPYAGLTGQVLRQASFTESSDFGLTFPSEMFHKLMTAAGVWASQAVRTGNVTYLPQVRVAWTHDLRNDVLTSQAALLEAPFLIHAADPGRDAAVVSLNLAAWKTDTLRVFAGYSGEFRRNAISQQATGGLRVAW